jgi:hypothetical protein
MFISDYGQRLNSHSLDTARNGSEMNNFNGLYDIYKYIEQNARNDPSMSYTRYMKNNLGYKLLYHMG